MSTSTVDNSEFTAGNLTGPQTTAELFTQFGNATADLEARLALSGNDTVSGQPTFTGQPIVLLPAGGGQGIQFRTGGVEAGHSVAHNLEVRNSTDFTEIYFRPRIDGSVFSVNDFGFDYVNLRWFVDTELTIAGETAWHAGNFDPTVLVPDSLKTNGRVYKHLEVLTGAAGVAVDATTQSAYFLENDQAMTLTFTWPAASADADLGDNFKTTGEINIINTTGHGTLTLAHASAVTDSEEIGSRGTGATEMYTLKWECWVIGASRYVQFTWIAA
jgi:hypothetical protein